MKKLKFFVVGIVLLAAVSVNCEDEEAEFKRLPKLFHLDDFDKCLENPDGVYCLGTFQIYNDMQDNPLYDLIQEKTQDVRLYNRTLLHRGYCLPTRCPSREANVTARFERCVDEWARARTLRTRLRTLYYCRAHNQPMPYKNTTSTPHRVFLYCIYAIVFLNVVGTVYDLKFKKKGERNVLTAFSLRINWLKLGATVEDGDPRIDNLQVIYGYKVILTATTIYTHAALIDCMAYLYNPRSLEKFLSETGPVLGAATTVTQGFVMMSTFLTTFYLLIVSAKRKIGMRMIPLLIVKRAVRIYPMYLLLNAYAATWWPSASDGPLWSLVAGTESQNCLDKFWINALFLQNIIEPERICLIQTWIIAVDMQIHVAVLIIVLLLIKRKEWAMPALSLLFVAVTAWTGYVAVKNQYKPAIYYMVPEFFRQLFRNEDSFIRFFIQPASSAMIAVGGVIVAFLYVDHQTKGVKIANSKLLVFLHYLAIPVIIVWLSCAVYIQQNVTDPTHMSLLIPIERLIVTAFCGFLLYSMINLKTPLEKIFAWKFFRIFMRLSFAVSMVHWCVNVVLVSGWPSLHHFSLLGQVVVFLATWVISHILALPLTVMVEYPLQKALDRLIFNHFM